MEGRLSLNVIAVIALLVTGAAAQLNTVKEVDVDAYVGRWFQVGGLISFRERKTRIRPVKSTFN